MKLFKPYFLTVLALLLIACHSFASTANSCVLLGPKPSIIIRLKPSSHLSSTNLLQALNNNSTFKFSNVRKLRPLKKLVFFDSKKRCFAPKTIKTLLNTIQKIPSVKTAVANRLYTMDTVPMSQATTVPTPSSNQWNLGATANGGIDVTTAWAINTGSRNAMVAVLDDGILTNTSLSPNLDSDNAASFYDAGTVAANDTSRCPTCAGADHGTHTSGSVAATGNGDYGENVYGVAYTARVLPINVFTKFTDSDTCRFAGSSAPCLLAYNSDIDSALEWLGGESFTPLSAAPDVVAANLSLGGSGSCDSSQQNAITQLYNDNIAVVISAGNSNSDASNFSPGNCNNVITVAATGKTKQKSFYSNYGSDVEIAAPGGDSRIGSSPRSILSTVENGYDYFQGTSMASPQVAGLISLLYSVDPTLTPAEALTDMQSTATEFASGTAPNSCASPTTCGSGIINAGAAVTAANNAKPTLQWTPNFSVNEQPDNSVIITWDAAAWSNASSTPILYTVKIDGTTYTDCAAITATSCTVNNLANMAVGDVPFTVEASDGREILTPDSQSGTIETELIAPTLTSATRSSTDMSVAYVAYSALGSSSAFSGYRVNGLSGVSVTLDSSNSRFVLSNVSTQAATAISITGITSGENEATSNTITLPKGELIPPNLTVAQRNPLQKTEVWLTYNNPSSFSSSNTFTAAALPNSNVQIDTAKQRFVIDNVTNPKAFDVTITETDADNDSATSNSITVPGILSHEKN